MIILNKVMYSQFHFNTFIKTMQNVFFFFFILGVSVKHQAYLKLICIVMHIQCGQKYYAWFISFPSILYRGNNWKKQIMHVTDCNPLYGTVDIFKTRLKEHFFSNILSNVNERKYVEHTSLLLCYSIHLKDKDEIWFKKKKILTESDETYTECSR